MVNSDGSIVFREPFFVLFVDVLEVDMIDVRLALPVRIGVVGLVLLVAEALTSDMCEPLILFIMIDEYEVLRADRLPPCDDGDDGIDEP
jgi:hypothetical protein